MDCPDLAIIGKNLTINTSVTAGTGVALDADSAPTYSIYAPGSSSPILTGLMIKITTGLYYATIAVTTANGFEAYQTYIVHGSATVSGTAYPSPPDTFLAIGRTDLGADMAEVVQGAIVKADILTFVNSRLQENLADIDDEIKATLADLSKFNLLTATPVEVDKVSGDKTIDFPSRFKKLVSITANDGSVDRRPLLPLKGGYKEYRQLLAYAQASSSPGQMWYAQYNKKFYVYPTLGQSFTFTIEYYQHHANTADTISFGDEFINAINYGACYHTALFRKKVSYIQIWAPIYFNERTTMISMFPPQPSIVR